MVRALVAAELDRQLAPVVADLAAINATMMRAAAGLVALSRSLEARRAALDRERDGDAVFTSAPPA